MKKVSFRLFVAMLFAVMFLASCGCEHEWQPADCRNPAICKKVRCSPRRTRCRKA